MDTAFPTLLSPIKIRDVELRNRIVMTAHGNRLAAAGLPTQRLTDYYEARAKGGVGLMFPHTLPAYPNRVEIAPGRLSIWLDDGPQAIGKMLDKIHEHGSAMFAQIGYAGRQFSTAAGQRPVFAPSPIPWHPGGEVPREMTASDIARFVKAFANTAERVRECGFDGVEIHGAHGYFLHEFLSPLSNHRTDDYGGSLENRARIVLEVLRAVRDAVGTDYVVGIRLSGAEFVEGGLTLDEQVKVAASLKSTGELDYVNVSAGAYASMERIVPPMYMPQGVHVHLAKAIKEAVGDTPVIATGRIYEPQFAEQVLSEGAADMVGMLRAMIADPDLPAKAAGKSAEPLRKCIGAMDCWRRVAFKNFEISCAVNPEVAKEGRFNKERTTSDSKQVLIIGAGPAGLESAVRLHDKGHRVTVWEKESEIGGQVATAAKAVGRELMGEVIEYFKLQLETKPIELELNKAATSDLIRKFGPDVLVMATGATPRRPDHLAVNGSVRDMRTALVDTTSLGDEVTLYTEGRTIDALTVADSLAASGRSVTIVTPHARVGDDLDDGSMNVIRRRLAAKGVQIKPDLKLVSIEDGSAEFVDVWAASSEGEYHRVPPILQLPSADLVCDFGDEANNTLLHQVEDLPVVYNIGDSLSPRGMQAAFWDAAGVALRI